MKSIKTTYPIYYQIFTTAAVYSLSKYDRVTSHPPRQKRPSQDFQSNRMGG